MKQLYAYIRVSKPKQGKGVSLVEQRAAIETYAARTGARIIEWFEEKRTAAKAGRPQFAKMMRLLRLGRAEGVIIHKVDRSSRNFRDWADIDDLIESGINVHFAQEDIDLRSRGGRLVADIEMVVAVDYIRNLREEALKGIHGRLKQGFLPHQAPLGYIDRGGGKTKLIDPKRGPIIRKLFHVYARGSHTLRELTAVAQQLGLRNRNGKPLMLRQIHGMIRNMFYAGILTSRRFGVFVGNHKPIVSRQLFDRVQHVLSGKFVRRTKRHFYVFRRLVHCETCGRSLIASKVKGHVYYRCSTIECPTTSLREESIDDAFRQLLGAVTLSSEEAAELERQLAADEKNLTEFAASRKASLKEAVALIGARLSKLADLLIDGKIEPDLHDERRTALLLERHRLEQQLRETGGGEEILETAQQIVELAKSPLLLYETADDEQKRRLLEIVLLNATATGKSVEFSLRKPFLLIAGHNDLEECRVQWNTPRTFARLRQFLDDIKAEIKATPPEVVTQLQSKIRVLLQSHSVRVEEDAA